MLPVWVAAVLACASLTSGCTCVACGNALQWSSDLPSTLDDADIAALSVEVCRNGECHVGEFAGQPSVSFATNAHALLSRGPGRPWRLLVQFAMAAPADGDLFTIRVRDSSGRVVAGLAETRVTYVQTRPNGPLDPTLCRHAIIDGSTLDAEVVLDGSVADR